MKRKPINFAPVLLALLPTFPIAARHQPNPRLLPRRKTQADLDAIKLAEVKRQGRRQRNLRNLTTQQAT